MIRPASFGTNLETSTTNSFQSEPTLEKNAILALARQEFDHFVDLLKAKQVNVWVFEDEAVPEKPDAIFPNNWLVTNPKGEVFLFPMLAKNRRIERNNLVIELLNKNFKINKIYDWSVFENEGKIVEGTGSLVIDYQNKKLYAALSARTDHTLVNHIAAQWGMSPICFHSYDKNNMIVYHTNVMMSLCEGFAILCEESIQCVEERKKVLDSFKENNIKHLNITLEQMHNFAGNSLEISTKNNHKLLVISQRAFDSLTFSQQTWLKDRIEILKVAIPTIENIGGGSVRCMLAEIFL